MGTTRTKDHHGLISHKEQRHQHEDSLHKSTPQQTDASDEDKDAFYDRLQGVMDKLPRRDINIIMGDANAKVGEDNRGHEGIMGQHGLGQMNENGERLAGFCAFNSLVIGGTIFPHSPSVGWNISIAC